MPHWKDQFRHKPAAKASDEEKRVERSETWEHGDPRKGERTGGNLRMGVRAGSPRGGTRFVPTDKPRAGISLRAGGGAKFEIPGRGPEPVDPPDERWEPPSAVKYLPKQRAEPPAGEKAPADETKPESAPGPPKKPSGVIRRIASLFRSSG